MEVLINEKPASQPFRKVKLPLFIILSLILLLFITFFTYQLLSTKLKPSVQQSKAKVEFMERIDKVNKTGQFVITPPSQNQLSPPPEIKTKQLVIEGTYERDSGVLTANVQVEESGRQTDDSNLPQSILDQFPDWLKFQAGYDGKIISQSILPLPPEDQLKEVSFKIRLSYKNQTAIRITNKAGKLLLSKDLKL